MQSKLLSYNFLAVVEELMTTKEFEKMSRATDEDEHSIELHLPYIAKAMERYKCTSSDW